MYGGSGGSGQQLQYIGNNSASHLESHTSPFCRGVGMVMHMKGIHMDSLSTSSSCLHLIFESWKLDSPIKFGTACISAVGCGFLLEALGRARRMWIMRGAELRRRHAPKSTQMLHRMCYLLLYALERLGLYIAMLVAMSYSLELLLALVLGFILGRATTEPGEAFGEESESRCSVDSNSNYSELNSILEEGGETADSRKFTRYVTPSSDAGVPHC